MIYDPNRGEVICSQCGLVITDGLVDRGPEWRAFDSDRAGETHARRQLQ